MDTDNNTKKDTAVVFRITPNLTFAVANVIIGIERYSPNLVSEYIIFCSSVNDGKLNELLLVANQYKKDISFIEYSNDTVIDKTKLDFSSAWFKRYPLIIFSLFEIFSLLKRFKCVIALDADMLVQDSIDELCTFGNFCFRPARFLKDVCSINNIPDSCRTPNAGLVVVRDDLNDYEKFTDMCYKILQDEFNNINNTFEETVLGILIYKMGIKCKYLDEKYNAPLIYNDNSKILHALYGNKFWEYGMENIYREWGVNDKIYKKILKLNYNTSEDSKIFISYFYEIYWQKWIEYYFSGINFNIYYEYNFKKNYLRLYIRGIKQCIHYELFLPKPAFFFLCEDFNSINKKNKIRNLIISLDVEDIKNISLLSDDIIHAMHMFSRDFKMDIKNNKISIYKNVQLNESCSELCNLIDKTWDFAHFVAKKI